MVDRRRKLLMMGGAQVQTYYVDATGGNDSNTGKLPGQAWQTIAKVNASGFLPTESILFKRGETWREELDFNGATVNNINIGAYGIGALPLLDASDRALNAGFAKTGGRANIYEIGITPDWYVASPTGFNCWENNVIMPYAANLGALDAAPGQCYISGMVGAITLYVHAIDSSDVILNGHVYDYTQRQTGLNARSSQGMKISNIRTRRNLYNGGSMIVGNSAQVLGCQISDGNAHNILIESGTIDGCIIDECYLSAASNAMIVFNKDTCAGEGCIIRNTTISNTITAGITYAAIFGHHNIAGNYGSVVIENVTFVGNITIGITFTFMDAITISNCTNAGITTAAANFIMPGYVAQWKIINNTIYTTTATGIFIDLANIPLIITGNTFVVGNTGSAAIYSGHTGLVIALHNNSFLPAVGIGDHRIAFWLAEAANTITASGNLFRVGALHWHYRFPNGINTFISDNNNFILNAWNLWSAGTVEGLASWQVACGKDASSTES